MKKFLWTLALMMVSLPAFAQDGGSSTFKGSAYFLAVGLAAFGGAMAQSRAATAALEGMARNPAAAEKIFTPMILALAFMESLVIFTLISVFLGGSL